MLWRRETGNVGTGKKYPGGTGRDAVRVVKTSDPWVVSVLYTDFADEGKIQQPEAAELAKAAIESVAKAQPGMDGISYLMNAIATDIETPLTNAYKTEILRQTGTQSLDEALNQALSVQ